MKLVCLLILCFSLLDAMAEESVKVKRMTKVAGYHSRYLLKTNLPQKTSLDCQSFIQGIFLGKAGNETVIQLEEWECEEVQDHMKTSLLRLSPYCLEIDFYSLQLLQHGRCPR